MSLLDLFLREFVVFIQTIHGLPRMFKSASSNLNA